MKNIIVIIFLISVSLTQVVNSQNYFPLKIGNKFVYRHQWSSHNPGGASGGDSLVCMKITDTTNINGKRYYFCTGVSMLVDGWVRVDSVTGSLYTYSGNNNCIYYYYENLVDSLAMDYPGTENSCNNSYCYGIASDTLFGTTSYFIHFIKYYIISGEIHRMYNKVFGLKYYSNSSSWGSSSESHIFTLKGCFINGIKYGDTIMTFIHKINTNLPNEYKLCQNYPNPFNPITNVKFSIVNAGEVKLVVYDIQGKEVQTLVNERLQPGTYEAAFDASSLNTGVYFYKLIANGFTETKKMLMIK